MCNGEEGGGHSISIWMMNCDDDKPTRTGRDRPGGKANVLLLTRKSKQTDSVVGGILLYDLIFLGALLSWDTIIS